MSKEKWPPLGLWKSLVRQTHQVKYLKLVRPGLLRRPTLAREVSEAGLSATATASDVTLNRLHTGQEFPTVFQKVKFSVMWWVVLQWSWRGRWPSRRSNTVTPAGLWARAAGRQWSTADAPASCRGECAWTQTGSSSPSSWGGGTKDKTIMTSTHLSTPSLRRFTAHQMK